MQVPNISMNKS